MSGACCAFHSVCLRTDPSDDCECGVSKRASRIVGGQETDVNEYPWMAGLVKPRQD